MADRYPLVVDDSNFRIEEIVSGDDLLLGGNEIKGAEKVGVGTSAPAYAAHINERVFIEDFGGTGDGTTPIDITSNANSSEASDIVSGSHRIRTAGGDGKVLSIEAAVDPTVGYGLTEGTIDGRVDILTRNQVRLSVGAGGSVGLGTTNPGEKLEVRGNIRVGISTTSNYIAFHGTYRDGAEAPGVPQGNSQQFALYGHTFIGERMYLPAGGSPGIGTTQKGREASELLLYKADNAGAQTLDEEAWGAFNEYEPDRVRIQGGSIHLCTHPTTNPSGSIRSGNFHQVGLHTGPTGILLHQTGNVGMGVTLPMARLHVGEIIGKTVAGLGSTVAALRVDGNMQIGYGATANYIAFHGTSGDGSNSVGAGNSQQSGGTGGFDLYTHTIIGERRFAHDNGGEMSELLLFKGNDVNTGTVGPDRIRLLSGTHKLDIIASADHGKRPTLFEEGCVQSTPTTALEIRNDATVIVGAALSVGGALSKGSGSFRIPHPIAEDRDLVHSFVEGPQADLIYRGKVTLVDGTATVNLDERYGLIDGTWEALCRDPQVWVTSDDGWTLCKGSVSGATLTITAQDPTCAETVSWLVVAERQDDNIKGANWTDEDGRPILEPTKASQDTLTSDHQTLQGPPWGVILYG